MSKSSDDTADDTVGRPIENLAEFYTRWPRVRAEILPLLLRTDLTTRETELLRWLIHLADKVGERDIYDTGRMED